MMSSLADRFATLDRMPMPELWPEVEHRAAAFGSAERPTSATIRMPGRSTGSRDLTVLQLAAALLIAALAGVIVVGSGLMRLPVIVTPPSPSTTPSSAPSTAVPSITAEPSASTAAARSPWIVYYGNDQLWAVRPDGTGAHPIQGGGHDAIAWSDDGTRLLMDSGTIRVAEVGEEIGPLVDTGIEAAVNEQWEAFDFAPDGERVVFVHKSKCPTASQPFGAIVAETAGPNCYVLSILDLRMGKLTRLDETLVWNGQSATDGSRGLELPAWSPDGTKIAYAVERPGGGRELWLVNADGTNPSEVGLESDVSVKEPRWSPDGTRISFTSEALLSDSQAMSDSAVFVVDLASGRLERIASETDTAARRQCCAEWIDNTHLRLSDARPDESRFWLVAVDGAPSEPQFLADLSGIPANTRSAPGDPGRKFFWQPIPEARP